MQTQIKIDPQLDNLISNIANNAIVRNDNGLILKPGNQQKKINNNLLWKLIDKFLSFFGNKA